MWASKARGLSAVWFLCGSRCNWWLASVTGGSSTNCVNVNNNGNSNNWNNASNELCVPV